MAITEEKLNYSEFLNKEFKLEKLLEMQSPFLGLPVKNYARGKS